MADINKEDVIEFISNMTVLELSELVKEMEPPHEKYRFGVPARSCLFGQRDDSRMRVAIT